MTEGRPELQELISKGNDWTRILRKAVAYDTRGCIEVMPNILTVIAETMESLLAALRAHPDLRAWQQEEQKEDQARVVTMGEGTDSRTASTCVAGSVDLPTPNQASNEP